MLAHAGGVPESVSTGLVGLGFVTGWIGLSRLRGRGFPALPLWSGWALVAVAPLALVGIDRRPLPPLAAAGRDPAGLHGLALVRAAHPRTRP